MDQRILIADDDADIRRMLSLSLQVEGYAVEAFENGEQVLHRVGENPPASLLILDLLMPGIGGMETLRRLRTCGGKPPVLVLSCLDTPDVIVEALQSGASDYLIKPFENEKLCHRIGKLMGSTLPVPVQPKPPVVEEPRFVALNPQMLKIQETIRQIAHTDVPVFIHGESGVGKEVVARSIHDSSNRRNKPFLKINCSALPTDLLESEMFGYEKGAFTGAVASKPGKFELADKGTIFLDEIGEMAPSLQAKLLQVLQDGQFSRLGGRAQVRVDVRVLAATNANIQQGLKTGAFREDLYYRINVVNVHVPPLRERMDELPALIAHFTDKYGSRYNRNDIALSPRFLAALQQYDWPGNIRELENVIRRYLVLDGSDLVTEELELLARSHFQDAMDLPRNAQPEGEKIPFAARINELKNQAQAEAILQALNKTNWNRKAAAKLLNISYKSLLYRMKVLNLGAN
ncbi:MAG: sigma-54-dependent Fis family transcriptional regulator [Acidobacteria bacterium]|nr:sigma-54-dependent Fis family transcriptional regulator [Acidobacteriota bacterium]